jgi:NADPH:quinone reductase-like Zn-dependent oxidoreductase
MSFVNPLTALSFIEIALKNRHKAIINNAAASALGRMVELMGKKKGIPVINIVRSAKNADMLRSAGSDYVIDSSTVTFFEDLRELSEKLEATLMFDSVCNRQLQKMIEALPHGSSVVIYGNLSGHENIHINPRSFMDRNIAISGFYLGSRTKENGMLKNLLNIRQVSSLMSSGMKIKIQSRFPLEQAQQAVDTYINSMSEGKVVLVV